VTAMSREEAMETPKTVIYLRECADGTGPLVPVSIQERFPHGGWQLWNNITGSRYGAGGPTLPTYEAAVARREEMAQAQRERDERDRAIAAL